MQIELLGTLKVIHNQETHNITGICAKVIALIVLLQQDHEVVQRSKVAGMLWQDVPEAQARRALNQALYRVKQQLASVGSVSSVGSAEKYLQTDQESLYIECDVDIETFYKALADINLNSLKSDSSDDLDQKLAALNLYRGEILTGEDAPWLEHYRLDAAQRYVQGLEFCLAKLFAQERLDDALLQAQRWQAHDPFSELAVGYVVRLYQQLGQFEAALSSYQRFETLIEQEFGSAPTLELTKTIEDIKQSQAVAQQALVMQQTQFVGRHNERSKLLVELNNLSESKVGKGSILFLEGQAGMGKSRLLEDFVATVRWRDMVVATGKAQEKSSNAYEPLEQVVQNLLTVSSIASLKLSPTMRQSLAPLIQSSIVYDIATQTVPTGTVELALEQFLQRVANAHASVLIFDDVQWASIRFWKMLPRLAKLTQQFPLMIILSFRPLDHNKRSILNKLDTLYPIRLRLQGLSEEESKQLQSVWQLDYSEDAAATRDFYQLSGGNPFVLKQLCDGKSETLAQALDERLEGLEAPERKALEAASVIGHGIFYSLFYGLGYDLWQSLLTTSLPLQSLKQQGFIYESGGSYHFEHDLLRTHVYERIAPESRRAYHQQLAQRLENQSASADVVAGHFEKAGQLSQALDYYLKAAKAACEMLSLESANKFLDIAETLELKSGSKHDIAISLLRLELHVLKHHSEPEGHTLSKVIEQLHDSYEYELLLDAYRLEMQFLHMRGDFEGLASLMQTSMQLAQSLADDIAELKLLVQISQYYHTSYPQDNAYESIAKRALQLGRNLPAKQQHFFLKLLITLAPLYSNRAEYDSAVRLADEATEIIQKYPKLSFFESQVLVVKGTIAKMRGLSEEAYDYFQELYVSHQDVPLSLVRYSNLLRNLKSLSDMFGRFHDSVMYSEILLEQSPKGMTEQHLTALVVLSYAYLKADMLPEAEQSIQPCLNWLHKEQGHVVYLIKSVYGFLCHRQGKLEEALELLQQALDIKAHPDIEGEHVEIAWRLGKFEEARAQLELLESKYQGEGNMNTPHTYIYLAAHYVNQKIEDLHRAQQCCWHFACQLERLEFRYGYVAKVQTNRKVYLAWRGVHPKTIEVMLPLITDKSQSKLVDWTIDAQSDDLIAAQGKVALRHYRLQRLIWEAMCQDVLPSLAALAEALAASERTIRRDITDLATKGINLHL